MQYVCLPLFSSSAWQLEWYIVDFHALAHSMSTLRTFCRTSMQSGTCSVVSCVICITKFGRLEFASFLFTVLEKVLVRWWVNLYLNDTTNASLTAIVDRYVALERIRAICQLAKSRIDSKYIHMASICNIIASDTIMI